MRRVKRIAILTLITFGCTTIRVPIAPLGEPADAPGVIAPPVLELWMESSEEIPAAEKQKAEAQARAAIASALEGREIAADAAGASDAVLFVRERAVGTTEARRSQQTWAKVGIVAAIVVVVVAIVAIAVSGGKGGSGGSHATASKSGGSSKAVPVAVKPRSIPMPPPLPPPPMYYGGYHPVPFSFWFSFNFFVPPRPMVLAPEPQDEVWYAPEPPSPMLPDADEGPVALAGAPPPPDPGPEATVSLMLPPLAPPVNFTVEDRGFFADPVTALQLDVLDRATGRTVWSKAVRADVDPLDAAEVAKLVDQALAGERWASRR